MKQDNQHHYTLFLVENCRFGVSILFNPEDYKNNKLSWDIGLLYRKCTVSRYISLSWYDMIHIVIKDAYFVQLYSFEEGGGTNVGEEMRENFSSVSISWCHRAYKSIYGKHYVINIDKEKSCRP